MEQEQQRSNQAKPNWISCAVKQVAVCAGGAYVNILQARQGGEGGKGRGISPLIIDRDNFS